VNEENEFAQKFLLVKMSRKVASLDTEKQKRRYD
jgi:hypothetical protein